MMSNTNNTADFDVRIQGLVNELTPKNSPFDFSKLDGYRVYLDGSQLHSNANISG